MKQSLAEAPTPRTWQLQSETELNKDLIQTSRCSDLQSDCKCRGFADLTVRHTQAHRSTSYLLVITGNRLKFMRAFHRQREVASGCHFQWRKTSAATVLQKVHLKHTINFPIADVTFYCPCGSRSVWVGRLRCAAFQSRMDVCVREQEYNSDSNITLKI